MISNGGKPKVNSNGTTRWVSAILGFLVLISSIVFSAVKVTENYYLHTQISQYQEIIVKLSAGLDTIKDRIIIIERNYAVLVEQIRVLDISDKVNKINQKLDSFTSK